MAKLVTTETLAQALQDGQGNARSILLSDRLTSDWQNITANQILNGTGIAAMYAAIAAGVQQGFEDVYSTMSDTYESKAHASSTYEPLGTAVGLLADYPSTSTMNAAIANAVSTMNTAIANAVAAKLSFSILGASDNLPTAGAAVTNVIYLKPNSGSGTNVYDEYLCVNKGTEQDPDWAWENIGSTSYTPTLATDEDIQAALGIS